MHSGRTREETLLINPLAEQEPLGSKRTGLKHGSSAPLTVALVARVYPPFQGFRLGELGQHFGQHALRLVHRDQPLLHRVIALRELQGKVPKGLNRVGFVVACYTGDLGMKCIGTDEVMNAYTCRRAFMPTVNSRFVAKGQRSFARTEVTCEAEETLLTPVCKLPVCSTSFKLLPRFMFLNRATVSLHCLG